MKIGLQNFQSIGAYTEINIAPITLFYGPNSAGKSTVVDAIEFLQNLDDKELLERHARRDRKTRPVVGKCIGNPEDVVVRASGLFDLNQLAQVLEDLSSDLREVQVNHNGLINLMFPEGHADFVKEPILLLDNKGEKFEYLLVYSPIDDLHKASSFVIGMNSLYLRETTLYVRDVPIFKVNFRLNYENEAQISFNIDHPSWDALVEKQFDGNIFELIDGFFGEDNGGLTDIEEYDGLPVSWLYSDHVVFKRSPFDSRPFVDQTHFVSNSEFLNKLESHQSRIFEEFVNILIMLPPRCVAANWKILSIPPIRSLPKDNYYIPGKNDVSSTLRNYSDCWENLASNIRFHKFNPESSRRTVLTTVNDVLLSPDLLDCGYYITGDVELILDADDAISTLQQLNRNELMNELSDKEANIHPYLVYKTNNYQVEVADVGVGISQVIPVIWASLTKGCLTHIQQPELHLHPKLQAQLSDVFIKAVQDRKYPILIESHSEHLLLRILRRIREANQTKGLSEDIVNLGNVRSRSLEANQVAVIYVKKDKAGHTTLKQLRLADDGEFIDRWPDGFFTERDKELFGDEGPFA